MRHHLLVAVVALTMLPAAAQAAAPANDARTAAQSLDPLPANVKGTTVGATAEKLEPGTGCTAAEAHSVWYRLTAAQAGRVIVELQADGDLDATVDVFRSVRSQVQTMGCDTGDASGAAAVSFAAEKGATYLVRVAQLVDSVPGTFTLRASAPIVPARPPGAPLPAGGVTRSLDRVRHTDDVWSATFHAGTTYRVHVTGRGAGGCTVTTTTYAPGVRSFTARPLRRLFCGEYVTITPRPGDGGRYVFRVQANPGIRIAQAYHLQVAAAGPDDTAPAPFVRNHAATRGALDGAGIDVVDLYRFDVTRRSVTFLDLSGTAGASLQLLDDRGRRLATGVASIHRGTKPGRYFVAVRAIGNAAGRYTLRRGTRVITATHTKIAGGLAGLRVTATTRPAAGGTYEIVVERFDPLAGWLFARRFLVRGHGTAAATYRPPGVGRYRAMTTYRGTRDAAPSRSRFAYATVGARLRE